VKRIDPTNINSILIRSANWVGDAVMTTPVIRAVRKNFPDARISLLAKPWVAPVFFHNPNIDEILHYDDAGRHRRGIGTFRLGKDLRAYGFDLAILMQNAFEAAFLSFLARIPNRLGYKTDGRRFLLTHGIRLYPALKKGHMIDYYIGILEGASLQADGRELTLIVTDDERRAADAVLKRHQITDEDLLVGINPGAEGGTAKRWLPDRYAALANRLSGLSGVRTVILGTAGDRALGQEIADMAGGQAVNLCGETTLRQAITLIERLRLLVTNDSGLMHVAAALNTPQIAVIGPTHYQATGPSNPDSRIIRVPTSCAPCRNKDCPTDHRCMTRITADTVFDAAKSLMENRES